MMTDLSSQLASPAEIGRASRLNDAAGRYIEHAKASLPKGCRLDGLKIVIDCANGAAYRVAPSAIWELGAEVIRLGCDPDGVNINEGCGSTHPQELCEAVVRHGADLGIALDGDADRMLLVDETGHLIDGDQILGLIARSWAKAGRLATSSVVATVMSNMGLERFLADGGLKLERTSVGDRYVVERMRENGANVGGEQSGHVVLSDFATTGDGLLAALQVLAVLIEDGRPASEVCRVFSPYPQLLKNIRFSGASPLRLPEVQAARDDVVAQLGQKGRLVLRESGTEPLVRVMVEAEHESDVQQAVNAMCDAINSAHVAA